MINVINKKANATIGPKNPESVGLTMMYITYILITQPYPLQTHSVVIMIVVIIICLILTYRIHTLTVTSFLLYDT